MLAYGRWDKLMLSLDLEVCRCAWFVALMAFLILTGFFFGFFLVTEA